MLNETILNGFNYIQTSIPETQFRYLMFGIYIIGITIYAIFIWKFYKFLAKRDLLELNLAQYNRSDHAFGKKFVAGILFILEYIIILPVVVFFWFFVMAFVLVLMAEGQNIHTILLISGVLVGAIRITSYYKEGLSRELAKTFPFAALTIAMLSPGFFNVSNSLAGISQIPALIANTLFYLLAIMALEFILRILYLTMPNFGEEEEN